MEVHLSLNVGDLQKSVDFYQAVFAVEPAKYYPDYAKFEVTSPPLVLALEPLAGGGSGLQNLNHLGVRFKTTEEILEIAARLNAAGLEPQFIEDVECCYSRQSKVVLNDPDGNLLEFYVLKSDVESQKPNQACSTSSLSSEISESSDSKPVGVVARATAGVLKAASGVLNAAGRVTRTADHMIGTAVPATLGSDDTLEAVRLRGTFNIQEQKKDPLPVLKKAFEALRPGGEISLHLLTSDIEISGRLPRLPGPAALVECAPREIDVIEWLEECGFEGILIERLSHAPVFRFEGAELRELLIKARKSVPYEQSSTSGSWLVYRGPFVSVSSKSGKVYRQGRRMQVSSEELQSLLQQGLQDQFVFLDS